MNTKSITAIIVVVIVAFSLVPMVIDITSTAADSAKIHTIYATLNSDFSDNTGSSPDNWTDVTSGENRLCYWDSTNKWVYENGDNGLAGWTQSLSVSNIYDGVTSATVKAAFRLGDNTGITNIKVQVLLDNGTDNTIVWQTTSADNSAGWISIDNDVIDNITATGTYKLWLWENIRTTHDNNNYTYWDDAALTVTTQTNTVSSTMIGLVPLFYVAGIVLAIVAWTIGKKE